MRFLQRWSIVALTLALVSSTTWQLQAQDQDRGERRRGGPGGPGGGPGFFGGQMDEFGLLRNADVRKELKVTEEEESYIGILADEFRDEDRKFFETMRDLDREERGEKMREHFGKRQTEVNSKLGEILGADRMKRLKEIRLQLGGPMALFSPDVAAELKITDEQRDKFRESMRSSFMEFRQRGQDDSKSPQERFEEFGKVQTEKAMAILTPDQKSQWEKMKGEPITFKLPPPEFGRGRGGFNRGGDGERGGPGGPGGRRPRRDSDTDA
jgi:hypothetical protein